jgi:hypothetical protein
MATIPLTEIQKLLRIKAAEYNHRAGNPKSHGAKVCEEIAAEIERIAKENATL